jgi:hypothetical protein
VQELEGIPWQSLYRHALRCQTATWGGWGNLILPMPDGNGDELLWALLDVFDADTFHPLPVSMGDLKELAPEYYRERYEEAHRNADSMPEGFAEMVTDQLRQTALVRLMLPDDLQALLVGRVAPLSAQEGLPAFIGDAADPPSWPLVAVEKLRPLPEEVRVTTGWPDDELALMGALAQGELSPRLRTVLEEQGVNIRERPLQSPDAAWQTVEPIGGVPSQTLASLGLAQYWRPGAELAGMVLCIGDEPWDFGLACARDRMVGDARWMPARAVESPHALATIGRLAARMSRRSTARLRVCSVSSPEAAQRLIKALNEQVPSVPAEICRPLELVPSSPARLYERERVGHYQAVSVHRGSTPQLPTPIPRNVQADSPDDIRWMTDIDAEEWVAVRHHSLVVRVLTLPIKEGTARCGRDGVSYFCPSPMTWVGRSLESQTVRPKLHTVSLLEQVEAVMGARGWRAAPSDKGIYLQQSADVLGGTEELIAALTDDRAPLLTAFLSNDKNAPGWWIDARRYLTFEELRTVYGDEEGADEVILGLEDAGALLRGLVLRCALCRGKRFYRLAEVGDEFQCSRCWQRQPVNQSALITRPEPSWRYGLAEVIFQFLQHNGDLPLLSSYDFMNARAADRSPRGRPKLQLIGELDVSDHCGDGSELDIVIAYGTELWIGEATTAPRLEKTNAAEQQRLERLRDIADVLCVRGLLLINGTHWDRNTVTRAQANLRDVWPRLELIEEGRQAYRWSPPPPEPTT